MEAIQELLKKHHKAAAGGGDASRESENYKQWGPHQESGLFPTCWNRARPAIGV